MRPTMVGQGTLNVDRAVERTIGIGESDEETVARLVDLLTVVASEEIAQHVVVPPVKMRPGLVADRSDQRGRLDNVCEHERPLGLLSSRGWDVGFRKRLQRFECGALVAHSA